MISSPHLPPRPVLGLPESSTKRGQNSTSHYANPNWHTRQILAMAAPTCLASSAFSASRRRQLWHSRKPLSLQIWMLGSGSLCSA
ncbi:hypothetical protein RRG08_024860 [Elysia crispata]|uniref:Uncharacterized protein n=1 Tax=Elysia crispata TaxID=231223 RepID=A0AAE0YJL7_9GAST|nr:hypothetical protein RRG08_024860 [Elysia crispata]